MTRFLQMKVVSWKNWKKSLSIGDISVNYLYIRHNKYWFVKKFKKNTNWPIYADISIQAFPSFAFVCHVILFAVGEIGILS